MISEFCSAAAPPLPAFGRRHVFPTFDTFSEILVVSLSFPIPSCDPIGDARCDSQPSKNPEQRVGSVFQERRELKVCCKVQKENNESKTYHENRDACSPSFPSASGTLAVLGVAMQFVIVHQLSWSTYLLYIRIYQYKR